MPQKATVAEMAEAVRKSDKPLTEREISEEVGVSRPTVRNYRDELRSHSEIEYGRVGSATAYWVAGALTDAEEGGGESEKREEAAGSSKTVGLVERLASLRTVTHGAALLLVTLLSWSMMILPTAGDTVTVLLLATGGVTLLFALLTMWAAALAQIALNRPLKGLIKAAPDGRGVGE